MLETSDVAADNGLTLVLIGWMSISIFSMMAVLVGKVNNQILFGDELGRFERSFSLHFIWGYRGAGADLLSAVTFDAASNAEFCDATLRYARAVGYCMELCRIIPYCLVP